jgi:heme/copper-type cytochrome/quinol oxidase subunit 2
VLATTDEQGSTPLNGDNSTTLIIIVFVVIIVGLVMLVVVILVVVMAVKCTKRTETLEPAVVHSPEAVYDTIPNVAIRKVG